MLTTIKKILYLLPPGDKLKLAILFVMMLIGALVEVVGIGVIPAFIAIVAAPDTVLGIDQLKPIWTLLGIENRGDILVFGAIVLIVVFVFKNAYLIFYNYIKARYINSRYKIISSSLFNKYMSAPYEFHLSRNTAVLLRNVTQETRHLAGQVMTPLLKLMKDSILAIAIFTALIIVEPLITIGVFLLIGTGGGLFLRLIKAKTRALGKRAQNDRALMIKAVNEGLGGFKDARVLKREAWFYSTFLKHVKSYSLSQTYREVAAMAGKPVIETIAVSGMLLITMFLYWQGRGLEAVIPVLALFATATVRLMPAVQGIASEITTLRYYSHVVEPVYNDTVALVQENAAIDFSNEVKGKRENQLFKFEKEICFDNVSYNYPGADLEAVCNVSMSIQKGTAVGIVGSSGAGKTTLVDLSLGLLKPQQGVIMVDEKDIHSDISSWQRTVGYIPQFIFLSDNTIKRNIAFGLPDDKIDEEKLFSAIEAAQLLVFVQGLPDGVDTIIGERGTRLSGGQRQRVGIARALYHNPQVLIMDEATSSLDNLTEKYVVDAIERLKGDRTVIIIAHRLTTVQNCDILYFMDGGFIVDSGSYHDLLKRNKNFKDMAFVH